MQDREFQEFRTTRVTGGGYKGIPNRLKQSRPGKLCVFTLYTIRCCFCQTGTMCDSVDAVRRRFKLSCLRHICARANTFRVRRYLSE